MKNNRTRAALIVSAFLVVAGLSLYCVCTSGIFQRPRMARIHEGLREYFKTNGEYPERLSVLVEQGYLKRIEITGCFQYHRYPNKGEFFLCYPTALGFQSNLSGPSYEYLSYSAKIERFVKGIRSFYFTNKRYPVSVEEYCEDMRCPSAERIDLLEKRIIKYEPSGDGLHASVNGNMVESFLRTQTEMHGG